LVRKPKRRMTAAHDSSSISMFVRAIHQLYTTWLGAVLGTPRTHNA